MLAPEVERASQRYGGVGAVSAFPGAFDQMFGGAQQDLHPVGRGDAQGFGPPVHEAVGVVDADVQTVAVVPVFKEGHQLRPALRSGLFIEQRAQVGHAFGGVHKLRGLTSGTQGV